MTKPDYAAPLDLQDLKCVAITPPKSPRTVPRSRKVMVGQLPKCASNSITDFFFSSAAVARGSLKRLVRRLRVAIESLMQVLGRDQRSMLDYESLMRLSNGSSLEAMRTMTELSGRVGPKSTSSRVSSKSKRRSQVNSRTRTSSSKHGRAPSKRQNKASRAQEQHRSSRESSKYWPEKPTRRESMITASSGSTKLGEVSRKHRTGKIRVAYPLYGPGYQDQEAPRKTRKWFGLFGG